MGRASGEGGVTSPGGLSARLSLRVYGFLCWALIPVLRWRLRRRARAEPVYEQRVDERLG